MDLWYELWERAGSQGLDTWHDPRGEAHDGPAFELAPEVDDPDIPEDAPLKGA